MNETNQDPCIESALACLRACERCVDCCAGQDGMEACLKLCLDCAEACQGCARAMARGSHMETKTSALPHWPERIGLLQMQRNP